VPLKREGITRGVLRVSYEVHDLRTQFNQLQWLVLGGVALTVLLGLGIGIGLATTITRPLRQLTESAQKIATGDHYVPVTLPGHDEFSVLAHSFNQMMGRLDKAEQTRERQLAAIVHELARPLAGMRAAVETLRDGADTDPGTRDMLLGGVEDELGRLERLIRTLQGLHKRTLHPIELNCTEITLDRVIRASVANYELIAVQLGITLAIDVPPDLPHIHADEDRIIQVLTNLLDNAFKYTPQGGRVAVHAGQDDQTVWVSVADTGVGLTPDELPFIFQQFYRGDASRPPEKSGVGLGLAICREIITAHQGQIEAKSETGRGACFTFTLPKG
jgi:signal transduction histidine kinase